MGIEPPASNYPTLQDNTLVTLDEARAAFPAIPRVNFPTVINEVTLPDFGPGFGSTGGRRTQLPPVLGPSRYELFVPKPDRDGLDIAGIRPMEVAAPTATLTGWNVRAAGHRGGRSLLAQWVVYPLREDAGRARGERRSTALPRGTLPGQRRVREGG